MFGQNFENALADWPKTSLTKDGGVRVTGKYWPPGREMRARGIVFIAGGVWALLQSVDARDIRPGLAFMVGLTVAWFVVLKPLWFILFTKKLDITIYRDRITLPGGLWPRKFSRKMPIEFRIEQHRGALTEKGQWRIYRDALEAVMQYGEKRIPLAEMPETDIDLARALVIRLQNVCDGIDTAIAMAESRSGQAVPVGDFGAAPDIR